MVEPEVAFADLQTVSDLAEAFVKYLIGTVLTDCREDLEFFARFVELPSSSP